VAPVLGRDAQPLPSSSIQPISPSAATGVFGRAGGPYRARTKGKTESAVKNMRRNALAQLTSESFSAPEQHLVAWRVKADRRMARGTKRCSSGFGVRSRQLCGPCWRGRCRGPSVRAPQPAHHDESDRHPGAASSVTTCPRRRSSIGCSTTLTR
jgi:hypothetical protein